MVTFSPLVSIVITLARLSTFPLFPRQQEGTCSHLNQPPPEKVGHAYPFTPTPSTPLTRRRSKAVHQQTRLHHCLHLDGCPQCQSTCPLKEAPGQGSHGRRLESMKRRNLLELRERPTSWPRGLLASPALPRPCVYGLSDTAHRQGPKCLGEPGVRSLRRGGRDQEQRCCCMRGPKGGQGAHLQRQT